MKILLVSRTIADLDNKKNIQQEHLIQAIELMGLNEKYFADF